MAGGSRISCLTQQAAQTARQRAHRGLRPAQRLQTVAIAIVVETAVGAQR
jgi:hypothetical protein